MEVMVSHNARCCGKIQAPHPSPNRDRIAGIFLPHLGRKTSRLLSKQQIITKLYRRFSVVRFGSGAESEYPCLPVILSLEKGFKAGMVPYVHLFPVIEARPPKMTVIHTEAQWMDQMEPQLRRSAQPRNVSGVIGNLRLI